MRIFCDAAALGSCHQVAQLHGITSAQVLEELKLFEFECGAPLFSIENQLLRLTEEGRLKVQAVRRILGTKGMSE